MRLIIASKNVHKIREFRAILKLFPKLDVLSLIDFPFYIPQEEIGTSFIENSIAKAIHAAAQLDAWVIADDSGLIVPALNGEPGIFSHRYAGDNATDKQNRQKLLNSMQHLQDPLRHAYFECVISLASPEGLKKTTTGKVEGVILEKEKGSLGFGYDSIFLKHEYGKTFAQLEEATKNKISHRRKALDKLFPILESLI